jgi:hypothetical protein
MIINYVPENKRHIIKINRLPKYLEDLILPMMLANDKLVLAGNLSLHVMGIIDYDFSNRVPDVDFSLTGRFEESEFNHLIDFFNLELIRRKSDYDLKHIGVDNDIEEYVNPKPMSEFLKKELLQVVFSIRDDNHIIIDYRTVDFFNKIFLEVRDIVVVNYFGTEIKCNHPSITLSAKMKYASDKRVTKQYKHFQDLKDIDWDRYFISQNRIEAIYKEVRDNNDISSVKLAKYIYKVD